MPLDVVSASDLCGQDGLWATVQPHARRQQRSRQWQRSSTATTPMCTSMNAHVTHYMVQGEQWTHLTAKHDHEHNHAALTHTHNPHQDEAREHRQEAHLHDHEQPAQSPA
jgi:hypothetical protein